MFLLFSTVAILDDSIDDKSICPTESLPKSSSIDVQMSKHQNKLLSITCDSSDLGQNQKSVPNYNSSHESMSNESSSDEIAESSNLQLECGQDELKTQLMKRCGQTKVLAFNEIYSAKYRNLFILRYFPLVSTFV